MRGSGEGRTRGCQALHIAAGIAVQAGGELDLAERLAQRLALLERERPGQLLAPRLDSLGDRLAERRALADAERGHRVPRPPGGLDRAPRVLASRRGHDSQHLARRRALAREGLAARRLDPVASDMETKLHRLLRFRRHRRLPTLVFHVAM